MTWGNRLRIFERMNDSAVNAGDRNQNLMFFDGRRAQHSFGRQLFRDFQIMHANRAKHHHQKRNEHDNGPGPAGEFCEGNNNEHDESNRGSSGVDQDGYYPIAASVALDRLESFGLVTDRTCLRCLGSMYLFLLLDSALRFLNSTKAEPVNDHAGL